MEISTNIEHLYTNDQATMTKDTKKTNTKKYRFCCLTLHELLTLLCEACIPIAIGVYTAISIKQQDLAADQARQFDLQLAAELRQQTLYDKFLSDIYKLDKDGHLSDDKSPWAFANAYHRAAHRQWDAIRKADVLQFLKEKNLIGKTRLFSERSAASSNDKIYLNELNFDNVHLTSQTGSLNHLDFRYIPFDQVSMINSRFSFVNLEDTSFDRARLNQAKFDDSSLAYASFDSTELKETNFGHSNLTNTRFSNVDLFTAKLTEKQLKEAIFYNTRLPNGTNTTSVPTTTTTTTTTTESTMTVSTSFTTQQSVPLDTTTTDRTSAVSSVTPTASVADQTTVATKNTATATLPWEYTSA